MRRDVEHREAVRVLLRDLVDDVEREVELVVVLVTDVGELPVLVLLALDELLGEQRLVRLAATHPDHRERLLLGVARHDHRDKGALLAANRDHAVGRRGLVEYRVAGVERLLVVAYLDAHRAGDDVVELLAVVGRRVDGHLLLAFVVLVCDEVGRRKAALEHRSHVADEDALLVDGDRPLTGAVHLEMRELSGMAFEKRGDVNAERKRTLVEERERRVHVPGLNGNIVPLRDLR